MFTNKLILTGDGFAVVVNSKREMDKMLKINTQKELNEKDYNPIRLPELGASRPVIITNVDSHIYGNDIENINYELNKSKNWIYLF